MEKTLASDIAQPILGEGMSRVLEDYAVGLRDVLVGRLAGVYLYGSAVWSAYDPSVSDVDVAVLLWSDPTEGQRRALMRMHEDFGLNHAAAAASLDVSFAPLRLVGTYGEDAFPYYRDGRFHPVGGGDVNPAMWRTLNERGIAVWGPAAAELVAPVGDEELAENMQHNLVFLSGKMPAYVAAGAEDQVFGVLCLCRVLYTLREKEIVGKAAAARWARSARWTPAGVRRLGVPCPATRRATSLAPTRFLKRKRSPSQPTFCAKTARGPSAYSRRTPKGPRGRRTAPPAAPPD